MVGLLRATRRRLGKASVKATLKPVIELVGASVKATLQPDITGWAGRVRRGNPATSDNRLVRASVKATLKP